jgi:hypothetical protein
MGDVLMNVTCHATRIAEFFRKIPWLSLASSCSINALPSVFFLAFMILSLRGEYYFSLFASVGVVFLAASILVGLTVWKQHEICLPQQQLFQRLFLRSVVAWTIAIGVLGFLSVTPLYRGEYNGDGINGMTDCIVMVILFAFTFTPSVLAFAAGTAYVSSRLFLCSKDKAIPPTQLQPHTK